MADEVVVAPPAGEAPPPVVDAAAETAALKAENQSLRDQSAEKDRATQFWYEKANGTKEPPAKKEAAAATGDDEDDILDILTSKGAKGFDELLAKRGYVKRADVDTVVNAKTAQLTKEAELVKRYPELTNNKSDFFKATSLEYGDLVKNRGVSESVAMEMAAERVELRFLREGILKTPKEQAAEAKAAKETDRLARIKAQSGDRGGRRAEPEDDSDELTPEQIQVAVRMLAVDGVTREEAIAKYKKRATDGVAVRGGISTGR